MSNALDDKVRACRLLRIKKETVSYELLSKELDIPVSTLSKYITGEAIPSSERAQFINQKLDNEIDLGLEVQQRLKIYYGNIINPTYLLANPDLLQEISYRVSRKLDSAAKVLTVVSPNISFATCLSEAMSAKLAFAFREKQPGVKYFEEITCTGKPGLDIREFDTFMYIPENMILPGEKVVIASDMIRTGETECTLYRLVEKCKATCTGIVSIVSNPEGETNIAQNLNLVVNSIYNVGK